MLLIKNGKILTMSGINYENGYIIIENGKIVEVGKDAGYLESKYFNNDNRGNNGSNCGKSGSTDDGSDSVIDASGKYVLPGFIDAHCHVGMWEDSVGFEGSDGNEATDPVTPQLRAIDGVYYMDRSFVEAREGGVTTVVTGPGSANVFGGQFAALKTYGKRVEDMIVKEPIAVKIAFGENPKSVYKDRNQMPTTRMATAAILRENLKKAVEYKEALEEEKKNEKTKAADKDTDTDKDVDKNKGKDKIKFDMKMDILVKVLNKEIPLKAHAHRADDILTAIRIAKEFDVNITIDHCTEGHLIKDILREEGISAIVGPFLTDRSKIELRNLSVKTPGILSRTGVKVAIMTDHPVIPIQNLWLCAAMAVREGMDEEEALKAITINAAQITGIDSRVGSIEAGKDADIVIFDGHPFDIKSRVDFTIINGEKVYVR
ncbi:MAG TPA: amidohydrolase family protein [Clostridiales bacterium]|nr:amidohydrolase family protein [Clostridiales bacterium]